MTQDEIIRLAEEAGVHEGGKENWVAGNRWEAFAKLVAARTWVGLTLEQYVAINCSCLTVDQATCSTERQLKENNT